MRFELSLVNYVKVTKRKTFHSNWILRNTHRHQPFDFYEIAELRKTWVSQKRNREILREMTFVNDCANFCFFFAQKWCAKKEKIFVSLHKNCAKVLRIETLLKTLIQLNHFFRFTKIWIFHLCSIVAWFFKKTILSGRIRHLKKIILEGQGFRGGSDEKMRRMWPWREIVVVGHPFFVYLSTYLIDQL